MLIIKRRGKGDGRFIRYHFAVFSVGGRGVFCIFAICFAKDTYKEEHGMRQYFPTLFGNDDSKERIGKAIESATLPHALLLCGPEGSGKKTLALEIAAAVNWRKWQNLPLPMVTLWM